MEAVPDFEDLLQIFAEHELRYLIVGGLAFIFHAKPRYTKDIDLWVENEPSNIARANRALAEFGSPTLLDYDCPEQVVQIGLAPNRIDLLVEVGPVEFADAWQTRVEAAYGGVKANWIGLNELLAIKSAIDTPRHQDDARVLREVKRLRETS